MIENTIAQHGRKFFLCLLVVCMAFLLALFGKLSPEFTTIATVVTGAFVAGNAVVEVKHASARARTEVVEGHERLPEGEDVAA